MTRVLIGCETSGIGRRAFQARWPDWDVWSVDLEPAEDDSNRHMRCDVRDVLGDGWDMAVLHPPCTRLCNSGVRWLAERNLWVELDEAAALFAACWTAPIPRVAVENPVMHRHAKERLPADLPKPQIVQPWWFGEPELKATGWYLRGLPPLTATNRLTPPASGTPEHKAWSRVHRMPPGPDRARLRSRSYPGMMTADAAQWGRAAV